MGRTIIRAEQVDENTLEDDDGDTKVQVEESADEDKIRFDTGGTERMIILNDGAVGIGITAPANPLSVYASVSSKYVALIDNDENNAGHVMKLTTDGTGNGTYVLDMESSSDTIFRARADGRFGFGTAGVSSMGAGTFVVGISGGHTSDIAISKRLQHLGDGNTYMEFPSADQLQFVVGGVDILHVTEDGTQDMIVFNEGGADVDFRVESDGKPHALFVNAGTNQVLILSGGDDTSYDEAGGADVNFYVSGSVESRGTSTRGTAIFGGDTAVSGNLYVADSAGMYTDKIRRYSGQDNTTKILLNNNHIKLYAGHSSNNIVGIGNNSGDDNNFWVAGTPGSKDTSTRGTAVFDGDLFSSGTFYGVSGMRVDTSDELHALNIDPILDTVSFFKEDTPGVDTNWFVSGSIGGTINHASFGGDLVVSGGLAVDGSTLVIDEAESLVGIGTDSPHSTTHSSGSFAGAFTAFSSTTYTAGTSHFILDYQGASDTDSVLTLPTPVDIAGRIYHILNNSASGGTLKVETPAGAFLGAELENDSSDEVELEGSPSTRQMQSITVCSTGANWFILHDGRSHGEPPP